MDIIFFLLVMILIAALAPRYSSDSRHLDDDAWTRDGLWSRTPRV
jgi:hypothetical protein